MVRILLLLLLANALQANPIEPIVVTEQSLQINGEQRFFFAFETGDEMVLDLSMLKGKFVKEFEVLVYQGGTRFHAVQVEGLKRKRIRVLERAIYEFRIKFNGFIFNDIFCNMMLDDMYLSENEISMYILHRNVYIWFIVADLYFFFN